MAVMLVLLRLRCPGDSQQGLILVVYVCYDNYYQCNIMGKWLQFLLVQGVTGCFAP